MRMGLFFEKFLGGGGIWQSLAGLPKEFGHPCDYGVYGVEIVEGAFRDGYVEVVLYVVFEEEAIHVLEHGDIG